MTTETPTADIVERLRSIDRASKFPDGSSIPLGLEVTEAADEITRLRAENTVLQRKLDEAVKAIDHIERDQIDAKFRARQALTSTRGEV